MLLPNINKLIINIFYSVSPGGGIGRRKGLKIPRGQPRAGSTPALGIVYEKYSTLLIVTTDTHRLC